MVDIFYNDFVEKIEEFHKKEPRAFCYNLSLNLIKTAKELEPNNWFYHTKTIEGILLLLFCWNSASPITKKLTKADIEQLMLINIDNILLLEPYNILNFNHSIHQTIKILYKNFKNTLGQTGASKILSLLNYKLFIMWDTKIRRVLKQQKLVSEIDNGETPENYLKFLIDMQRIIIRNELCSLIEIQDDIAKKIDEFHYAKIVVKIL